MDETPGIRETDGTEIISAHAEPARRRRWPWAVGAIGLGLALWLLFGRSGGDAKAAKEKGKGAPRPIPVVAVPAKLGDMPVTVTGLGTVTALNIVTVRSRIDGQLVNLAYREGQLVKKGDLLAEIDPRPYDVQLQQAEGQLAKDEATLKNARVDLARYETLVAQDAISRQQLDTQGALVNQLEASLVSDRSQVASARLNLTYCRITSPLDGRVGLRQVDPGNMIRAADPNGIVVVAQLQPIAVTFTIPADQLPPVLARTRDGRKLPVEAWDRDVKTLLASGTLEAIDNQIDPTTGTVKMKALFENREPTLYPNQFVNARLLVDTLHGAVLAPTAALQRSPQATYVWVVKPDGTAEMRNVTVALTAGEQSAIASGLLASELVVTDGTDRLQPGTPVTVAGAGAGGGGRGEGGKPAGGAKGGKKRGA